jgi:lysophospholipase L1-like esterase
MTRPLEPMAPPVRVLVKGASASVLTSWMGGPRTDLAYPRVIEAALYSAGRHGEVRVSALPADRATGALKTWDKDVLGWSPDVVILHYGQADMVHLFLPRWLERHANSPHRRPGRIRSLYRRRMLRAVWIFLARLQTRLDARLDSTRERRRHRTSVAHLALLIEQVRTVASPLILVPTLLPPGPSWSSWFPGSADRMRIMNDGLERVVREAAHPDVRIFPLEELVAALPVGEDGPTPDGGHFTPEVHEAIGQGMAEVILDWVEAQPHLREPG